MPEIEFVTLANHAEAHDGLLYLQGAGWTNLRQPLLPNGMSPPVHIGIGVSILLGWNETNQAFNFSLVCEPEDGGEPLFRGDGRIEQGRPPGVPPGIDFRSVLAINADVTFPQPGGYRIVGTIGGGTTQERIKTVSFRVEHERPPGLVTGPPSPTSF